MKKSKKFLVAGGVLLFVALTTLAVWGQAKANTWSTKQYQIKFQMRKEESVRCYRSPQGQKLYLVGTVHDGHLKSEQNYSLQNLQAVIQNVQPSHILIEARQHVIDKHNAVDGPIEMLYIWSYAQEQDIMVSGMDWWQPDKNSRAGTTTSMRDDKICEQIMNVVKDGSKNEVFLAFMGQGHLNFQHERLTQNGYVYEELENAATLFESGFSSFSYPKTMADVVEKKIEFMRNGFIDEVLSFTEKGTESFKYWDKQSIEMVDYLKDVLNAVIIPNKLFYDVESAGVSKK